MSAYNAVNGSACSQNSYLLNGILKDELGFQGFVMSDWLSHMSGVASAIAGLDMDMPGDTQIPLFGYSYWMYELTRSVLNGSVPVDRLNDMATRIVAAWYQMGQDQNYPPPNFSSNTHDRVGLLHPGAVISPSGVVNEYVNVQADHYKVARQVAQDAITLLKNDGNLLPLSTSTPLKVFGTDAEVNSAGPNACGNRACDTGTLGMGWGSGVADYPYFDSPMAAIKRHASNVTYYNTDSFPSVPTPSSNDIAIVFINSDSGENSFTVEGNHGDRDSSKLAAWHGGDTLVQKAAAKYSNVVVVVHTVGPLILESWVDLPSVKAVLFAHLPGQEAGESLTNVLFGTVSPSGHLPYSITKAATDLPDSIANLKGFAFGQVQDTYSEGL
jgi:beta-glucosidase-like glycosyl hydrolase